MCNCTHRMTGGKTLPRHTTMKTRSLLTLVALAISFALPIFTEEKERR